MLNKKTIVARSENIIKQSDDGDMRTQYNKIILKPIEIKDPNRKKKENNLNSSIIDVQPGYGKEFDQFSKTSDLNFKVDKQIDLVGKRESNNVKMLMINNPDCAVERYTVRLEEMITLGIIASSGTCGLVKKMLHVPSLKIYTVRVKLN
jgi:hypothetical protein